MSISNLLNLSGRTVLVTGASSGIGAAIVRKLAKAGAEVILHYGTDKSGTSALADEVGAKHMVQCNLSKPRQIKAMLADLAAANCTADMLVNNAGVQTVAGVLEANKQVWRDINRVNLEAVYGLSKYMAKALIAQKRAGSIVNIASIEGLDPAQGHAHYAASKAALLMYTRASALELGQHNIRVNAVAPGLISRPGLEDDWPEGVKRWQGRAPLGRLGTGEDVANGVLFLLSPAAVWISGHTLAIDGGMGAQNRW